MLSFTHRSNCASTVRWPGRSATVGMVLKVAAAVLAGCPPPTGGLSEFDRGYDDGFAEDERYFEGYDDSWLTEGMGPIRYSGADIPFIDDETYLAGFWDGVYIAYNDGYFVAYRNAFIIGFSEGYDNAYWDDFLTFLANDFHTEYLHGGFSDAYNDGFSEGRVYGAFDFEAGLPFDWEDAFLDWEDLEDGVVDLYFEEIDIGTGEFGDVLLYEYNTDPNTFKSGECARTCSKSGFATLRSVPKQALGFERPLGEARENELSVTPTTSERNERPLRLDTTWLERIQAGSALEKSDYVSPRIR